ncbi:MAG: hypothetical protein GC138_08520, partial [Gammaproteobacteria bacterium]|nr:hypothetical protein [Gammaproteobacteria bacterium]
MESIGWMLRLAFVALVSTAFCVEAEELSGGATSVPTPVAKERFHVFDATLYASKPDLSAYGIDPLPVVYQTQLWPESEALDRVPTSKMLKTILSKLGSVSLVCFDVEHWKLLAGEGSFEQNMEKFGELTRRVHELAPG